MISDQGVYECEVTSEVDRFSLKHEVRVFNRSRIMEHPAHGTVIQVIQGDYMSCDTH